LINKIKNLLKKFKFEK